MQKDFKCITASGDKSIVYVYGTERQGYWYCIHGGTIVNETFDEFYDGIEIEKIRDTDSFTWNEPIESIEDLALAVIS